MQADLEIEIRDLRLPGSTFQDAATLMTHLRPKNTPSLQYLEAALAKNVGRGIPKQPSGRPVPGKDLTLLAHGKGGICGPLQKGKQLTLKHSKPPKCALPVDQYEGSIERKSPARVYDQTLGSTFHRMPRGWWLSAPSDESFLCISKYVREHLIEQQRAYRTFQFEKVVWKSKFRGRLSASEHPTVEIGNPPVFKGTPDVWCPEDLLIGALNTCLMFPFPYRMGRRQLGVLAYQSSAQGTLEHRDGKHRVTRITVQPRISLKDDHDMEAAREAINDTVDSCMISNSILASVQVDPQFDAPLKPAQ